MKLNAELTGRETQVAELLAWGVSKKEIADRLCIAERTVENHARSIYDKTGVQKATELSVWWFCKKCGVPADLDPLKRAFIAILLLITILPRELSGNGDVFRIGRTVRITRVVRRRNESNEDLINPFE